MADNMSDMSAAAAAVADAAVAAAAAVASSQSPDASLAMSSAASSPSPPSVQVFSPALHGHLVLYLAALHGSCITHDGLSGTFALPLHHEKLLAWWKVRLASSTVLLWFLPFSAAVSVAGGRPSASDLVGAAMLSNHPAETSPHVAVVELLLVNPRQRNLGGELLLMAAAEQQALAAGKTLLTAETDADSPAARTFTELGFVEAGRIPDFVMRPTGEKRDQVVLYKNLVPL